MDAIKPAVRAAFQFQKGMRAQLRRARHLAATRARQLRARARRVRTLAALGAARVANECAAFNPVYRAPGEQRTCPACASGALKPLDVMAHHRRGAPRDAALATGCRACGLVFVNPLPSDEELAAFYAEGAAFAEDLERRGLAGTTTGAQRKRERPKGISDEELHKLRLLFEPVRKYLDVAAPPPGARVLDYGCGPGRLLNRLQSIGWTTFGIEPAIKSAFQRHHELQAPPDEPTFRLVTLHHVLEHLRHPLDVLKTLSRSMLEDGILYVSVPRLDALPIHRDFDYCLNPQAHIVAYTRDCLATLLDMAGLAIVTQPEPQILDELLTDGQPRRLRVFARKKQVRSKADATDMRARPPLDAAEAAIAAFHGRPPSSAFQVRLRASRLQSARRRELLAHRWQRLRDEPGKRPARSLN